MASASPLKSVALLYFDAGGGHRAAARALAQAIALQERPWATRLVNLQEVLLPIDIFRRAFGINLQDLYNQLLFRGYTLGAGGMLKLLHGLIRLTHRGQLRCLEAYWRAQPADLIVSLVPNFNRAIHQSVRRALPGTPSVTLLTDLADYPPHFWIEPETPAVICGTPHAAEQAAAAGLRPDQIHTVSGMLLDPRLYATAAAGDNRAALRSSLGLWPDLTTALVLFGGMGSSRMLEIAQRLAQSRLPLQLILVCGHNQRQEQRVRQFAQSSSLPMRVEGYSHEIPRLMAAADFMIGKPGPGSVSEALHSRLPLIVERNAWTLPQERYNADWIRENELGLVLRSFEALVPAVHQLLAPGALERFRRRAAAIQNRAVWEIPVILDRLLNP